MALNYGVFRRNRAEPGCRCRTENIAAEGFIPLGISVKGKSVTMISPIKNEGIFIVTLGFSEQSYGNFYAGLKDECQLSVDVHNDPVERFEHERIAELGDFSNLVNQKAHLFRTVSDEDVLGIIDR